MKKIINIKQPGGGHYLLSNEHKGFTLIELLAVIAILGILAVIAVPTLIKIFKDAKMKTFETGTKNILKAAKQGYDAGVIDKGTLTDTTYTYENGVLISKTGNIDMEISGKKIQNGTITIYSDGKVSFEINDGEYQATKDSNSENIEVSVMGAMDCSSCFAFNSSTGTITDYKNTCPACTSSVVIPSTINSVAVTKIGANAFNNKAITNVTMPVGVTEIGNYAFANNSLTTLSTPDTITSYGEGSFSHNILTSVTIGIADRFCCDCISMGVDTFRYNRIPQGNASFYHYAPGIDFGNATTVLANNGNDGQTTISWTSTYHGFPEKCV